VVIVSACSPTSDTDGGGVTVFAAASLRDVFDELETAWAEDHPEAPITTAYAASNVLAAQIREGAPADVFVSADTERPRQLAEAGEAAGEPVAFARNRVTIVTPAGSDRINSPADLALPGVRLVAVSSAAPISRYADQALAELAQLMPDPDAFAASVAANTVSREDNVRASLAKVELGEGDAAIVYRTDALSSDQVREIPLSGLEVNADYAALQISDRPIAAAFTDWLSGPQAQAIMKAAGFEAPST
jgi:molybdate transport system substrate-binding protein